MTTGIIKRDKHIEDYDPAKLQVSIKSACLSVRTPAGEAELTARKVAAAVETWLAGRPEVTAADIRRKASEHLQTYNPEASYLYARHRIMA